MGASRWVNTPRAPLSRRSGMVRVMIALAIIGVLMALSLSGALPTGTAQASTKGGDLCKVITSNSTTLVGECRWDQPDWFYFSGKALTLDDVETNFSWRLVCQRKFAPEATPRDEVNRQGSSFDYKFNGKKRPLVAETIGSSSWCRIVFTASIKPGGKKFALFVTLKSRYNLVPHVPEHLAIN